MADKSGAEVSGALTRGSISRRMLIATAIWSAVVLVITGWFLLTFYRSEAEQQLDSQNNDTLRSLAAALNTGDTGDIIVTESLLPGDEKFKLGLSGRYWAFLEIDSRNAVTRHFYSQSYDEDDEPDVPTEAIAAAVAKPGAMVIAEVLAPGHCTREHSNAKRLCPPVPEGADDKPLPPPAWLRVGVQAVIFPNRPMPVVLMAGIDRTAADKAVGAFALSLGISLFVLAVGLVAGIVILIRYGLRPLHTIQHNLGDVRAGRRDNLDGEYPTELTPLVTEINTLITHNRKVVERARTHVGNLAHALKTPLAVLKNEAKGSDKLSELVRRQTEAMTSNVTHYLKRAQAAAQAEVLGARTDVREPVEGIARMLERLHRDKGLAIDVDVDANAIFRGERGDFDELIGNLLENAAKWCKSRINVKVTRNDDGLQISVDDDGPGLPPEHRAKALERGKRLDESAPGTGLGLSIVTELADIYGGRLHLEDSPIGGLRARLELPAAPL